MKKYDVFISYSWADRQIVTQIQNAFDSNGISYFIDLEGLSGGNSIPAVLSKAIMESEVFLFVASKNSYASKYATIEVNYAFNNLPKARILTYLIDNAPMPQELVFLFGAFNWRKIDAHPIDTVLISDIAKILHRPLSIGKVEKEIVPWVKVLLNIAHVILFLGSIAFTGMYLVKLFAMIPGMSFLDNGWTGHFEIAVVTSSFLISWYGILAVLNWEKIGVWLVWFVWVASNICYFLYGDYSFFSWQSYCLVTLSLVLAFTAVITLPSKNGSNVWRQLDARHNYRDRSRINIAFWTVFLLTISLVLYAATDNREEESSEYFMQDKVMSIADVETVMVDDIPFYMIKVKESTHEYYIGMTEVTCEQWRAVMGYNKAVIRNWNHPVTNISWFDCIEFCLKLSEKTGLCFSIPSVKEWNYVATAGSYSCRYSGSNDIDEVGWYQGNSHNHVHAVGQKLPNAWGFYDMSGNVWEWCSDPVELTERTFNARAVCGGGWESSAQYCVPGHEGNNNFIENTGSIYHGLRLKLEIIRNNHNEHIDSLKNILNKRF